MTLTDTSPTTNDAPSIATVPWFARLARFSGRRRKPVIFAWLVLIALAAPLALTLSSSLSGAGWEAQGSTAQKVRDELRRDFPQAGAEAAVVVYQQRQSISEDSSGLRTLVASLDCSNPAGTSASRTWTTKTGPSTARGSPATTVSSVPR